MRDFALVFKILFKNQNVRLVNAKGRRKLPKALTMLVTLLPMAVIFALMFGIFAPLMESAEQLAYVLTGVLTIMQILALVLSIGDVLKILYNGDDAALLNSLPLKFTSVFFAKFTLAYLNMLEVSATLSFLPIISAAISFAAYGKPIFPGIFPLSFVIAAMSALLPMAIITLVSMPLKYVIDRMKGKNLLKSIISVGAFVLFFTAYIVFIYLGNNSDGESASGISPNVMNGFATFAKVAYPNYSLIAGFLGINSAVNVPVAIAIHIGILALVIALSAVFSKKIALKSLEVYASRSGKKKEVKTRSTGIVGALVKKEFKTIARNQRLALQGFAMPFIAVIITFVMYFTFKLESNAGAEDEVFPFMQQNIMLCYAFMMTAVIVGANGFAINAYTREGKSYYITRTLPINWKQSVLSKLIVSMTSPAAVVLINAILMLALYKIHILNVLLFALILPIFCFGTVCMHIFFDMKLGNVNWATADDFRAASQANWGSFIVSIVASFASVAIFLCGIFIGALTSVIGVVGMYAVFWGVAFFISAILAVAGGLLLFLNAPKLHGKLGDKQFVPKPKKSALPKMPKLMR